MGKFTELCDIKVKPGKRYLVKHMIPASGLTVVWGKPKSGKTFWVLDLALHIAAGIPYRGRDTTHGPVFYITYEGKEGFNTRILAAAHGMGIMERRVPFYASDLFEPFSRVGKADEIVREIQATGITPVLVILDTLNMSLDGDENSSEDMRFYTRCTSQLSQEFGCCVLVVHHCGVDGSRPRGHTSLTGTCDAQISVARRGSRGPGGSAMIEAKVEFMKDGPEENSEFSWLQPITFNDDVESCYLVEAPAPAPGTRMMASGAKRAMSTLQKLIEETGERSIKLDDWKEAYVGVTTDKKHRATALRGFNRALESLMDAGTVIVSGTHVTIALKA